MNDGITPIITMPVPPEVYGSDAYYGRYWRDQYDRLLLMAKAVERDRDRWKRGAIHLVEIEDCSTTNCDSCAEIFESYDKAAGR
jgi:hypothetical protein